MYYENDRLANREPLRNHLIPQPPDSWVLCQQELQVDQSQPRNERILPGAVHRGELEGVDQPTFRESLGVVRGG